MSDVKATNPPAESGDASASAAKPRRVDPKTLRALRWPGPGEPPPIEVVRMRALSGTDRLERVEGGAPVGRLRLAPGAGGEIEELLGRADTRAAMARVDQVLSDAVTHGADPDGPVVARSARARALLMEGAVAEARQALGSARDAPGLEVADAALALAEGDTARARQRLQDAMAKNAHGVAEHYLLALLRVAEGDIADAARLLGEVARSVPGHAVARFQLGQLILASGDVARAGTLFEMAQIIAPGFVAPALAMAELLADSRQYSDALAILSAACDAAPATIAPRILQIRILLDLGEKDAAMQLATLFHPRAGHDPAFALVHAEALLENERGAEARTSLQPIATHPEHGLKARRLLARVALQDRPPQVDDALTHLKAAAQMGSSGGEIHLEIVCVALAAGRRRDAEEALEFMAVDEGAEVGALLSAALTARTHGLWAHARRLGERARGAIAGTPAEAQVDAFLATLPTS